MVISLYLQPYFSSKSISSVSHFDTRRPRSVSWWLEDIPFGVSARTHQSRHQLPSSGTPKGTPCLSPSHANGLYTPLCSRQWFEHHREPPVRLVPYAVLSSIGRRCCVSLFCLPFPIPFFVKLSTHKVWQFRKCYIFQKMYCHHYYNKSGSEFGTLS